MGSISILSTNWAVKTKKISAELVFEPGATGWEARMLPLCYGAPRLFQSWHNSILTRSNKSRKRESVFFSIVSKWISKHSNGGSSIFGSSSKKSPIRKFVSNRFDAMNGQQDLCQTKVSHHLTRTCCKVFGLIVFCRDLLPLPSTLEIPHWAGMSLKPCWVINLELGIYSGSGKFWTRPFGSGKLQSFCWLSNDYSDRA